jgi:predicted dehydrogenase
MGNHIGEGRYRIGMVGAGNVTTMHLDGYKERSDTVQVVAMYDLNPEALQQRADAYGIAQKYTSLEHFIEKSNIDAAVVCTPSTVRKQVILPLIQAGIPVFCEKPFAETLEEAIEITEIANKHRVPVCVNQNFRLHYSFDLLKSIIEKGTIGKVVSISFQDMYFRQDVGWRTQCERNSMSVMGVHWFDGFRRILGCEAKKLVCQTHSSSAIDCLGDTEAHVQMVFENDSKVSYIQSFSTPYPKNETIVIGETGMLVANYTSVNLYRKETGGASVQSWANTTSKAEATFDGLNQLLKSIESGEEASNSANDNLKTIALLEAAYTSAKEQRTVTFNHGSML